MPHEDLVEIDPQWLLRWNRPVPRYTSYPTAPQFYSLGITDVESILKRCDPTKPLSLYIHIPFCRTMCLFCGCSVILNRRPENQADYVDLLCREIALVGAHFPKKRKVTQLHFGGGTPTMLDESQFILIFKELQNAFSIDNNAEISIEIDPRTVYADHGAKLRFLRLIGFNRVSFGVQDLDPEVQEAVRRRQSEEMTLSTYWMAREIGFSGINLDLIYGLPYQTREKFQRTAERIAELRPDRIALFSYAKIPWLKAHQKAMPEKAEPTTEEKFQIYVDARAIFMRSGFDAIGMDHFSLKSDSLSIAYHEKKLWRNFQGYSLKLAEDMIGLGITSIGFVENAYLQNVKTIQEYRQELMANRLPIFRGFILDEEDRRRRWAIQSLMCHFELNKQEFENLFHLGFDMHFSCIRDELLRLQDEGLLIETKEIILPTAIGRLFIRLIASLFDAYLSPHQLQFSKSI